MDTKPPLIPSTLGKNVKRLRLERDLSQDKLAKRAGMYSKVHVCRLERGNYQTVEPATLAGIARALRCSMETLLKEPALSPEMEELLS